MKGAVVRERAAPADVGPWKPVLKWGMGVDVTAAFLRGARATLDIVIAKGARLAILKDGSPSCATTYIHDGSFRAQRDPGMGVTAAMLAQAGIRLFNERQIEEAARFLEALESEGEPGAFNPQ